MSVPSFIEIVDDQPDVTLEDPAAPSKKKKKTKPVVENVPNDLFASTTLETDPAPSEPEPQGNNEQQIKKLEKALARESEREAMLDRYNEAQAQIQNLQQEMQHLKQTQVSRPEYAQGSDSKIQAKKNELELAKQEYLTAKQSFNSAAEIEAMSKFGVIQWELKELEKQSQSVPQSQNSLPIQSENIASQPQMAYNSNTKALKKLEEFTKKPENSWMSQHFDKQLHPLTPDGLIANNLFTELSSKGHMATQAFWDLYQEKLRRALPSKYTQRYGKGSPNVSPAINAAPPVKKEDAKLNAWESMLVSHIATDNKSKKRVTKMLKTPTSSGIGTTMFELGV